MIIPLTSLTINEPLTAWYRLIPQDSMKSRGSYIADTKRESAPRRDVDGVQIKIQLKLMLQDATG